MFTGIITQTATVFEIKKNKNSDLMLAILVKKNIERKIEIGSSIAVDGVCLTVIKKSEINDNHIIYFQISNETISLTKFSSLSKKDLLNIEFSLRMGDEFGGHLVSGHIDGLAEIAEIKKNQQSHIIKIKFPKKIKKFISKKGSVVLNGISLTVNEVMGSYFYVNIIPHTWENTNLKNCKIGDKLNLEIDMIARYLDQLMLKN
jgi:riboflavin synthase